jgi:hypothetical protein
VARELQLERMKESMACNCEPEYQRKYYSAVQMFTELHNGQPGGDLGLPIRLREIVVCKDCGKATFFLEQYETGFVQLKK